MGTSKDKGRGGVQGKGWGGGGGGVGRGFCLILKKGSNFHVSGITFLSHVIRMCP